MRYNLAAIVRRAKKTRRREITLRPIIAPSTLASDLYASCYAPVVKAWLEALPAIMVQYERSLAKITTDSPEQLGSTLAQTEGELSRIVLLVRLRLERWALKVEGWQRGKWRGAILSATGVDIGTMIGPGDMRTTLGTAIERNVAMVKSVSEQAQTRISQAVFEGLTKRLPARDVAKQVRAAVDMSRARSLRIASDQLTKISSELDRERRREAGIDTWEWVSSGKINYRPEHQARNGKRYSDDNPPPEMPGELIHCGCTSRAVLDLESEF